MPSRRSILFAFSVLFLFASHSLAQEWVPMTNERMEELLKKKFGEERVEGQGRAWRIVITEDDEAQSDEGEADEIEEQPSEVEDADSSGTTENDDEDGAADDANDEMPGSSVEEKLPAIMVVMTDDRADRMRLMMPIRKKQLILGLR